MSVTAEAEENSSVTLMCLAGNRNYIRRLWYRGHFTSTTRISYPVETLYHQFSMQGVRNFTARADMSVDPTTFALTIGRVQLEDDDYFTCRVYEYDSLRDFYENLKVQLFSKFKLDRLFQLKLNEDHESKTGVL